MIDTRGWHLVDQDPDGMDDSDSRVWSMLERAHQADLRSGPAEDSAEVTAPYIDGNPGTEADDVFFSRPLRFGDSLPLPDDAMIDDQIQQAYRLGLDPLRTLDKVRGLSSKRHVGPTSGVNGGII